MPIDVQRLQAVFLAAIEIDGPAERAQYLDGACEGDAELRARVEALLRAHDQVDTYLDNPAVARHARGSETTVADGPPWDAAGDDEVSLGFLAPATRPDSLGRIGHYEVLQVLGHGGFGIVFRALDDVLQRVVAVKVLSPEMAATSPARKRFLREARSSAQVRHENVVQVYEVAEHPLPYLVMEFIPGETLQQKLDRTGPLEVPEVLRIGRQIAAGLAASHDHDLIHRDIKPANVLLESGPHGHAKITDFGLARAADDASISQSGIVAGTPMYMAPEQAQGQSLDHRADLFSLGSVLYQMVSGRSPFRANTMVAVLKRVAEDQPRAIREIIPETPQWLCDVIAKLHAKKPEDRFASAREVADLLMQHLGPTQHPGDLKPSQVAALAAPEETWRFQEITDAALPPRRPRPRSRRWVAATAVFVMLLGGLGFAEATGVTEVRSTVIRLFSPEGTLEIQIDDPATSVRIDGSDLVITGAGVKEIRLKAGRHTVEARKDGQLVRRELVTITRDDRQVVRVYQEPSTTVASPNRAADFTNSIGMEFVLVPTGRFWMGGGGGKPGDKAVAMPYAFYLGRYEVTQEEWAKVMKTNPSSFQRTGPEHNKVTDIDEKELLRFPVDNVSWDSCQAFIARLNELEKGTGWTYRLPTEAEWEYACRGGPMKDKARSAFSFYLEEPLNTLSPDQADISRSGLGRTRKVGSYPANRLGLHDMHGNVWEWCDDRIGEGKSQRVHRGGSYRYDSEFSQAAHRGGHPPLYQSGDHGLRLARVPSASVK